MNIVIEFSKAYISISPAFTHFATYFDEGHSESFRLSMQTLSFKGQKIIAHLIHDDTTT
jgi:hypothetical protein